MKANKKVQKDLIDQAIKEEENVSGEKKKIKENPVAKIERGANKDAEVVEGAGDAQIDAGDQAQEIALTQGGAGVEAQVPAEVEGMKLEKSQNSNLKSQNDNAKSKMSKLEAKKQKSKARKAKKAEVAKAENKSIAKKEEAIIRSKKYLSMAQKHEAGKILPVADAVKKVKELSYTKFDGTVELHVRLIAKKKSDDVNVRGTINLPSGSPKTRKIIIASDEIIEEIGKGKIDFDILLATPAMMPKLARVAKILGPKGKMPSPKSGTVTDDPEKTKQELSSGLVEYKTDAHGNVHVAVGKVFWEDERLVNNINSINSVLPQKNIASISLSASMSPSVRVKIEK